MRSVARVISLLAGVVSPWPLERMPFSYTGAKGVRYQTAYYNLLDTGQRSSYAQVTAFVKAERLDPNAKVWPFPRIIQFRSAEYCVEIAQYIKPVEHAIYELCGDGVLLPQGRLIGKGLNSWDRGRLISEYFVSGTGVIQLDLSQFDRYYSTKHLLLEQFVYLRMLRNARFKVLLRKQLVNIGKSFNGVRYRCSGNRMSGDMNTACGACLMMLIVTVTVLRYLRVSMSDVHLLIDGDDTLVFLPLDAARRLAQPMVTAFAEAGFVLKVDGVADSIEAIRWCQCRPVWTPDGYRCVRDYRKVLSQALAGFKYVDSVKARRKLVAAVSLCEYVCGRGIPVLQEYAIALRRNVGDAVPLVFDEIDDRYYHLRFEDVSVVSLPPAFIDVATRSSFARAFGLEPLDQVSYEQILAKWSFTCDGIESGGPLLDGDWLPRLPYWPCDSSGYC